MTEPNPYEPPSESSAAPAEETTEHQRPSIGTVLIFVWLLEGGIKAFVLGTAFQGGFNPVREFALEYRQWNPVVYFLVASFFVIETIGPWIGIYYLTGQRARTIPFLEALWKTLKLAGVIALTSAMLLVLYCELTGVAPL